MLKQPESHLKQTITAKLKLYLTPEQKATLDRTTLAYRDGLNYASEVAFENGKTTNQTKLHKLVYPTLRERYGLPSQMGCSVSRTVTAAYKTQWTKVKQAKAAKDAGRKVRRHKGLDHAPRFVSRTLTYVYGRDMTFKPGQRVSIGTLKGRIVVPYEGYNKHLAWIEAGAEVGESKLYYEKARKQYYLLVSLEVDLGDTQPDQYSQAVGVDVGQRYLMTATNPTSQALFVSGKQVRQRKDHYARVRRGLQQKGTRSAKRRLVALEGRERRFTADVNHKTSCRLLKSFPQSLVGIEALDRIRDRTERRSSAKASWKQKRANRRRSQWSFAELHAMLGYKAPLYGSLLVKVDADYTSQQCLACGHRSRGNRPHAGLLFQCEECAYKLHADLVGARNICMRTLLVQQDWISTGRLSFAPDVSSDDAKAKRLQRFSELRWSLDTSPA
ncbi:MAG: transposase [Candidatus Melainabacteria bacterium HGW-Melainabacteria-1]|nr:MAG: transposase [Candidatus Melainabacteria bacterium HGW-Melainabacteria-1]